MMIVAMAMFFTAMLPAGVLLAVVVTLDIRVVFQTTGGQGFCSLVSITGYTAV